MPIDPGIQALIDQTSFVDTHEHLFDENSRILAEEWGDKSPLPRADFASLLTEYVECDLISCGMTPDQIKALHGYTLSIADKWKLVEPHWNLVKHTGYGLGVRGATQVICGESDFTADNVETISAQLKALIKPGFYKELMHGPSKIEYAQVNALDKLVLNETPTPDILMQDMSFIALATPPNVPGLSEASGIEVKTLNDWYQVIDWAFEKYGPLAIAMKNQCAYTRRLNFDLVSFDEAAPLFAKYVKSPGSVTEAELKAIEDHLWHHCIDLGAKANLPIKIHTGYTTGNNAMRLDWIHLHLSDLEQTFWAHTDAKFVLMHMTYPIEEQLVSMAKQYGHIHADMCWAWIINPNAAVRFLKDMIVGAPASHLFTFGGDHLILELAIGHARVARRGLALAMSELVEEGWISRSEVDVLVPRLMHGNAHDVFDYEGVLKRWPNG